MRAWEVHEKRSTVGTAALRTRSRSSTCRSKSWGRRVFPEKHSKGFLLAPLANHSLPKDCSGCQPRTLTLPWLHNAGKLTAVKCLLQSWTDTESADEMLKDLGGLNFSSNCPLQCLASWSTLNHNYLLLWGRNTFEGADASLLTRWLIGSVGLLPWALGAQLVIQWQYFTSPKPQPGPSLTPPTRLREESLGYVLHLPKADSQETWMAFRF